MRTLTPSLPPPLLTSYTHKQYHTYLAGCDAQRVTILVQKARYIVLHRPGEVTDTEAVRLGLVLHVELVRGRFSGAEGLVDFGDVGEVRGVAQGALLFQEAQKAVGFACGAGKES
jgi:hypothetical protein